jgi:hypothetical protein
MEYFFYICKKLKKQMKQIKLLIAFLFILSLSSCTITEKMIVNENGSGKFAYEIDASKMISMVGSIVKEDQKKTKKKKKRKNEIDRESKDIDSTFTFKEMFASKKDSIATLPLEEQEKIKKMENFSVHIVMNEEKGILNYTMFTDFNSIQELQDVMSPINSMKSLNPSGSSAMGSSSGIPDDDSSTKFFYDGKKFSKIVSKIEKKKEETPKEEASKDYDSSEEEVAKNMKQSLNMFYDQSNFKVVYQFPKAVKKVSISNALYSEDRKTITIEYPLKEYMESPQKLNFEIEFE